MSSKADAITLSKAQTGLQIRFDTFINADLSPFLIGAADYLEFLRSHKIVFQAVEGWVRAEKEQAEKKLRRLESEIEVLLSRFETADYSLDLFDASRVDIEKALEKMRQYKVREIHVGDAITHRRILVLLDLYENLHEHQQDHICDRITSIIGKDELDKMQLIRTFRHFLNTFDTWEKEKMSTVWGRWDLIKQLDLGLNGQKMIATHDGELPEGSSFLVHLNQKAVANLKKLGRFHKCSFGELKMDFRTFHLFIDEHFSEYLDDHKHVARKVKSVRYDSSGFFEVDEIDKIPFLEDKASLRGVFLKLWPHRSHSRNGKETNEDKVMEVSIDKLERSFPNLKRKTIQTYLRRISTSLNRLNLPIELRRVSVGTHQIFVETVK